MRAEAFRMHKPQPGTAQQRQVRHGHTFICSADIRPDPQQQVASERFQDEPLERKISLDGDNEGELSRFFDSLFALCCFSVSLSPYFGIVPGCNDGRNLRFEYPRLGRLP